MGRKTHLNRKPIPNNIRVKMYRQRKKLKTELRSLERKNIAMCHLEKEKINVDNENESTLKSKLRDWVNSYRISKRAVDNLLSILKSSGINSLPKNHRTLLETPTDIKINELAGGKFWYNGIENSLKSIFSTLDSDISISLNFSVDGLPLYNSSKICFWPILASIHGL